jgi:hypothetical protein
VLPTQGIRLDSGGLAWLGCPKRSLGWGKLGPAIHVEIYVRAAAWRRKKERENRGKKKKIKR